MYFIDYDNTDSQNILKNNEIIIDTLITLYHVFWFEFYNLLSTIIMTTFYKSSMFPNIGHNNSPNIGSPWYIVKTFLNILIFFSLNEKRGVQNQWKRQ